MSTTKKIFAKATSIKTIVKKAKETKGSFVNFVDPSSCVVQFNGTRNNVSQAQKSPSLAI